MKNNKVGWVLAASCGLWVLSTLDGQARDLKIGVVNMERTFSEFFKTPLSQAKIDDFQNVMKKRGQAMEEDLKGLSDECRKLDEDSKNLAFAESVRLEKGKLLDLKRKDGATKQKDYQDFVMRASHDIQSMVEDEHKKIVEQITKELDAFAKEENFDLVFDKSGKTIVGLPALLSAKDEFEITNALIKRLNAKAPPAEPKPSTPKPTEPSK